MEPGLEVNKETSFQVNVKDREGELLGSTAHKLHVHVVGPNTQEVPVSIKESQPGVFEVHYTTGEVGINFLTKYLSS